MSQSRIYSELDSAEYSDSEKALSQNAFDGGDSQDFDSYDDGSMVILDDDVESLGTIYPGRIEDYQRTILELFIKSSNIKRGDVVNAGHYTFYDIEADGLCGLDVAAEFTYLGDIDPTQFKGETRNIIKRFLKDGTHHAGDYIPADYYSIDESNDDEAPAFYVFHTVKSIITRSKVPGTLYYDVVSDAKLASGTFGGIHPVEGTIKVRTAKKRKLKFIPSNKRVAKEQAHDDSLDAMPSMHSSNAEREYSLSQRDTRLAPKGFSVVDYGDGEIKSVFTLKRIHGQDMFEFIMGDRSGQIELSLDDRYQISIAILHELKRIHDLGIVHRDIKPENIMISYDGVSKIWGAKLVDYGLSASKGESKGVACGTVYYAAPEVYFKKADEASDFYSIAKVLALLWRDESIPKHLQMEAAEYSKWFSSQDYSIDLDLFHGMDIPENRAEEIRRLLAECISAKPYNRPTIPAATARLELSYFQFRYRHPLSGSGAYHAAASLRDVLNRNTISKDKFLAVFEIMLLTVKDQSESIAEFVHALGIKALHGATSSADIMGRIKDIFNEYDYASQSARILLNKLKASYRANLTNQPGSKLMNDLGQYLKELSRFEAKAATTSTDLDHLVELTEKIQRKNTRITASLEYYAPLLHKDGEEEVDSEKSKVQI